MLMKLTPGGCNMVLLSENIVFFQCRILSVPHLEATMEPATLGNQENIYCLFLHTIEKNRKDQFTYTR